MSLVKSVFVCVCVRAGEVCKQIERVCRPKDGGVRSRRREVERGEDGGGVNEGEGV